MPAYSRDWGEAGAREVLAEAARAALIEIPTSITFGLFAEVLRTSQAAVAAVPDVVRCVVVRTAKEKRRLVGFLGPYESGERGTADPSRWSAGKDLSWEPLRLERVCEVKYDHMQGDRFRHAAVFQRWRPDKPPSDCRYDQLEVAAPSELATAGSGDVLAGLLGSLLATRVVQLEVERAIGAPALRACGAPVRDAPGDHRRGEHQGDQREGEEREQHGVAA